MSKSALPLLVAGGAAILLLGGKKKKSSKRKGCVKLLTPEDIAGHLKNEKPVAFPAAVIVYPDGGREKGSWLCDRLAEAGAATIVMGQKETLALLEFLAEETGQPLKTIPENNPIRNPGIIVFRGPITEEYTAWDDIPWDNPKSLMSYTG